MITSIFRSDYSVLNNNPTYTSHTVTGGKTRLKVPNDLCQIWLCMHSVYVFIGGCSDVTRIQNNTCGVTFHKPTDVAPKPYIHDGRSTETEGIVKRCFAPFAPRFPMIGMHVLYMYDGEHNVHLPSRQCKVHGPLLYCSWRIGKYNTYKVPFRRYLELLST